MVDTTKKGQISTIYQVVYTAGKSIISSSSETHPHFRPLSCKSLSSLVYNSDSGPPKVGLQPTLLHNATCLTHVNDEGELQPTTYRCEGFGTETTVGEAGGLRSPFHYEFL